MWPRKKKTQPKFIKKTRLLIYRKDGKLLEGFIDENPLAYLPFKHWFCGRPQSQYFVMPITNGEVMILRELIGGWKVYTIESQIKEAP